MKVFDSIILLIIVALMSITLEQYDVYAIHSDTDIDASTFQEKYAAEIIAIPQEDPFGPNDWIVIDLEIDGYSGGIVKWNATKPDGNVISGELTSFKASKKTHTIIRDAFDNQFGTWTIDYLYAGIKESVTAKVEPIIVTVTTDKETYFPGETVIATLKTNYFNPNAAQAESYRIEIHDENGDLALQSDYTFVKAYQKTTTHHFNVDELLKYNPRGTYYAVIQYYDVIIETPFSIGPQSVNLSIFLGTDKSLYTPGDLVEINVIVSEVTKSNAVLKITNPTGNLITRTFPINSESTKVKLDDVSTNLPGSYQFTLEYDGIFKISSFQVIDEDSQTTPSDVEVSLSLDKKQYRPGEVISANFQTNRILGGPISFWFEDPLGNLISKNSFTNPSSGAFSIQHVLLPKMTNGPWKMHINYAGVETFGIFFVAGEPIEGAVISNQKYEGQEVLLIIDNSKSDFNKIEDVAIDSQNNLYVLDGGNSKIKKFDSQGNLITSWGTFGSEEGQLKNPSGIFVDSNFVHVTDKGNSRIMTFDIDGNYERMWGNSGIEFQSLRNPEDIAIDSSGTYFVSDSGWNKILKFDEDGKYVGHIESLMTAAAKFSSTNSIVSDDDRLFILVAKDNRILHFLSNGAFVKSFGTTGEEYGKFISPGSIALDKSGNIFVADSGNHRVQILDSTGKFLTKWGSFGTGYAQFMQISGISVDSEGNIYTADSEANRILKFASFKQVKLTIPDWIRNNASWWANGQINDDDFAGGIKFMIEQKIIVIPDLGKSEGVLEQQIPDWIKNNAKWWSEEKISDEDFANGIEYLVKNGIIQV